MGGTCTDYTASPKLGEGGSRAFKVGGFDFCVILKKSLTGLVTYSDGGGAVQLVQDHPPRPVPGRDGVFYVDIYASPNPEEKATVAIDITQAQLNLIRSMQPDPNRPPAEIGVCHNPGGAYQVQPLPMKAGPWTAGHAVGIQRLFGEINDRVLMCVDGERGEIGINTSSGAGLVVGDSADTLRREGISALGPGFDEAHYQVLLSAFNRMSPATTDPNHRPISWFDWLLFAVFAYHPMTDLIKAFRSRSVAPQVKDDAQISVENRTRPADPVIDDMRYAEAIDRQVRLGKAPAPAWDAYRSGTSWLRFLGDLEIDKDEWERAAAAGTWGSLITEKLRDPDCQVHRELAKALHPLEEWLESRSPDANAEEFRKDVIKAYVQAVNARGSADVGKIVSGSLERYLKNDKMADTVRQEARTIIERVEKAAEKERRDREEREKKGI